MNDLSQCPQKYHCYQCNTFIILTFPKWIGFDIHHFLFVEIAKKLALNKQKLLKDEGICLCQNPFLKYMRNKTKKSADSASHEKVIHQVLIGSGCVESKVHRMLLCKALFLSSIYEIEYWKVLSKYSGTIYLYHFAKRYMTLFMKEKKEFI